MREDEFAAATARHRRALHVHCYRMLGSFEEAEDAVQETLLRAWRGRHGFDATAGAGMRAWLYRIATNTCLDAIKSKDRRMRSYHSFAEVPWLQPYPDRLLDELAGRERALLQAFIDAHERGDIDGSLALMREDIRVTMPPHPYLHEGRAAMLPLMQQAFGGELFGDWRLVPAWANRQPAAISYVRLPGDSELRAFKVDVLPVQDGLIREITTFDARLHAAFGVPEILAGA